MQEWWAQTRIGVVNIHFILWLTHLWRVYIEPTAGDRSAVIRRVRVD